MSKPTTTTVGSLCFRVCVYLAARPGTVIDSDWIATHFHYGRTSKVADALRPAVRLGYLSCAARRGSFNRYAIGPKVEGWMKGAAP